MCSIYEKCAHHTVQNIIMCTFISKSILQNTYCAHPDVNTFFVMKKRQESCSLRIHVTLQNGLAHCEMIVCLVCFSFGLLVLGLWRNSVVVFASTHETNVPASMNNGMRLFTTKGRPKCPVTECNAMLRKCRDQGSEDFCPFYIHMLGLIFSQVSCSVHQIPMQKLVVS